MSRRPLDVIGEEPGPARRTPLATGLTMLAVAVAAGYYLVDATNSPGPPDAGPTKAPSSGPTGSTRPPLFAPRSPREGQITDAPPFIGAIEIFVTSGALVQQASLHDSTMEGFTTIDTPVRQEPLEIWPLRDGLVVFIPPLQAADLASGPVALYRAGGAPPKVLGEALAVIPAASESHFWLAEARQAAAEGNTCVWVLVAIDGLVKERANLPCNYIPVLETVDGFVGTDMDSDGTASGATLRSLNGLATRDLDGFVVGASHSLVASWDFAPDSPLALYDLAKGSISDVPLPPGRTRWVIVSAQPSHDGAYLAVSFYNEARPPSPETWVYDVARAQWQYVAATEGAYGETLVWAGEVLIVSGDTYRAYDPEQMTLYATELQPAILGALAAS